MRPRSKKRAKQEREYSKLRSDFVESKNWTCEVCGVQTFMVHVHHKKGRMSRLLTDVEYWLCVCPVCHEKIELNPKWAKEQGYSLSRLSQVTDNQ